MTAIDIFIVVNGLVLGSFLYTTALRLQNKKALWKRSKCPMCGNPVAVFGLLPILGYLFQRGRCARCQGKISRTYPIIELINAILLYLIFIRTGWSVDFLRFTLLFEVLLVIAILDFKTHLIFPQPVVFGVITQTICLFFLDRNEIINALLGLFLGAGIFHWIAYLYRVLRNRVGLGEGDATLLGLIGFGFGWGVLFSTIFWAALIGILGGAILLITKRQSLTNEIAFGPWLAAATFLVWFQPDFFQSFPFGAPFTLSF